MRAAHIMAQDIPNTQIVAPRELVEAAFARGSSPSASARKAIALMLHKAAGDAWEPGKLFSIPMSELRGSHKGNGRLRDVLDEVQRTLIRIETLSPAGKHAIESAPSSPGASTRPIPPAASSGSSSPKPPASPCRGRSTTPCSTGPSSSPSRAATA